MEVMGKNQAVKAMLERFKAESNQPPASPWEILWSFVGVVRMLVGA
jgi:hypothetical protein